MISKILIIKAKYSKEEGKQRSQLIGFLKTKQQRVIYRNRKTAITSVVVCSISLDLTESIMECLIVYSSDVCKYWQRKRTKHQEQLLLYLICFVLCAFWKLKFPWAKEGF